MPSIPKTKKIASLARLLHRRFKGLPLPSERTVLEHLMYAALLENASFEEADAAYTVLESYFIDWNEVRVSTVRELADTFSMLPTPMAAGERVRRSLQGIFEKTYMYDLEELRRKGKTLGQAVEFLRGIPGCSRFMVDYAAQVALGGHLIPVDEAALRVFRLLGLTVLGKEGTQEDVPGLERAVPKKDGLKFFLQLHYFASGFFRTPESVEFRTFLKPVDPEVMKRDWTPPVLVVPKAASKPLAPKRPLPVVTLPFAPPDDDDFEEEAAGTEAEFLPDEPPYRPDDRETTVRTHVDAPSPTVEEKKGKGKKKTPEPPKKAEPPARQPVVSALPPGQSKLVVEAAEPLSTPKRPQKKTAEKKQAVSTSGQKAEPKREPAKPKLPPVKEQPKTQKQKSPPASRTPVSKSAPPPTAKPTKSSTKQLREKKPK